MITPDVREWLSSAQERYETAKNLIAESENDPPNDPYHSKYKARKIFCELDVDINSRFDSSENFRLKCLSALFNFHLGVISMETEDLHAAEVFLSGTWEKIGDFCDRLECCFLAQNVLNHLGILWFNRGDHSKACKFLKKAEEIYDRFKELNELHPWNFSDLFILNEESKSQDCESFDHSYTYTGYYLAQVYEELNENELAAKYCFMTLKRQQMSENYDILQWILNSAMLSQYFITKFEFLTARHLLASSSYVLSQHELKLKEEFENKEHEVWEAFNQIKAKVSKYRLKYCMALFLFSIEQKMKGDSNKLESNPCEVDCKEWRPEKLMENDAVLELEKSVCGDVVENFEDARHLFLAAQENVNEAKHYYTLNNYANDYVQLLQDHSKLYTYLVHYETDLDRQCKMHKRRADMLESVLSRLNPQFYLSACRQLQFELGEIFAEMMNLKFEISKSASSELSASAIKKINSLIMRSVKYFENFLDTLKDKNKTFPKKFYDELVRPALVAHCYLGRCYFKIIEFQEEKVRQNLNKSKEYYNFIETYVETNPDHSEHVKSELDVVKEMTKLLQTKLLSLNNAVIF